MDTRRTKLMLSLGLIAALTLWAAGAWAGGVYVTGYGGTIYITQPAPLVENIPLCPGYGYVWTPGYWSWTGFQWLWVSGYWCWEGTGVVTFYGPPVIGFGFDFDRHHGDFDRGRGFDRGNTFSHNSGGNFGHSGSSSFSHSGGSNFSHSSGGGGGHAGGHR